MFTHNFQQSLQNLNQLQQIIRTFIHSDATVTWSSMGHQV